MPDSPLVTRVKVLKTCTYSPDGIEIVQLQPETADGKPTIVDMPTDVAVGLIASELVEEAEGSEPAASPQPVDESLGVRTLAAQTSVEATELDSDQQAKLAEAAAAAAPLAAAEKPDIEPVEHGDVTIDRTLTRGVHPDAVAVEDADVVATMGKNIAGEEVAAVVEEAKAAQEQQADAPETKMEESAPENKAAAVARRGRPRKE